MMAGKKVFHGEPSHGKTTIVTSVDTLGRQCYSENEGNMLIEVQ